MSRNRLHAAAITADEGAGNTWHSLPPHVPGTCYGRYGDPCPDSPSEPCPHNHRSSQAALSCSRNRPPFEAQPQETR